MIYTLQIHSDIGSTILYSTTTHGPLHKGKAAAEALLQEHVTSPVFSKAKLAEGTFSAMSTRQQYHLALEINMHFAVADPDNWRSTDS